MVLANAGHFGLSVVLKGAWLVRVRQLFVHYLYVPVLLASVTFIFKSAMFAWSGKPFDLQEALTAAGGMGLVFAIMPFLLSYERRKGMRLLRNKVGLRRKWRECEEEVERLRSSQNER